MHDQHNRVMATIRHRSLVGRGRRKDFVRDKGLAQLKKNVSSPISQISKERLEQIKLLATLLEYFQWNNKCNRNQSLSCLLYIVTVTLGTWDYVNRIAFKAPTRTLLFYYRDMQQKILHTLPLEKYGLSKKIGNHHGQDTNTASSSAETSEPAARYR